MPDEMRTKVREITRRAPIKSFTKSWGIVNTSYRLVRALAGTFCFPAGGGYECGFKRKLTFKEGRKFSGSFSVGGITIAGEATLDVTQEFEHTAGKCQTCDPIICYFNSTLSTWAGTTDWGIVTVRSTKTIFDPGTYRLSPNCRPNPNCPGCSGKKVAMVDEAILGGESAPLSMLTSVAAFDPDLKRLAAASEADFEPIIREFYIGVPADCELPFTSIAQADGATSADRSADANAILLSEDGIDREIGGLRLRSGQLPIVALLPQGGIEKATLDITSFPGRKSADAADRITLKTGMANGQGLAWGVAPIETGDLDKVQVELNLIAHDGASYRICRDVIG